MFRQRQASGRRAKQKDEQTFAEASFRNAFKEELKSDQMPAYHVR